VLPHVEDLLAAHRLRPVFLFEQVKTRRIRPEEITGDLKLRTLRNLNTRADYEQGAGRRRSLAGAGPLWTAAV
jgi:molybdopterin-guanine dinucleotide biosynthesis protein A